MIGVVRIFSVVVLMIIVNVAPVLAQDDPAVDATEQLERGIEQLRNIRDSLVEKGQTLSSLKQQVSQADEIQAAELREDLARLHDEIAELELSFEQIAIGGIDMDILEDEPGADFDFKEEMELIARPLITSLKEITEKPRKMEELRSMLSHRELQLDVIRRSLVSIARFEQQELPPRVAEQLGDVAAKWRQQKHEIERLQEISRLQLKELERADTDAVALADHLLHGFLLGRGLTLLIAIVVGTLIWVVMRVIRGFLGRGLAGSFRSRHPVGVRVAVYSYHTLTVVFLVFGILAVFYVREDMLLLALALLVLVGLALGARQYLPRYVSETRLLLDMGTVRERERVIYNGVPYRVAELNVYSVFENPELDGKIRLPLSVLENLASRPDTDDPWFPCRPGDFVMFPDGGLAEVLRQSVEIVEVRRMGSTVQMPTAEFLGSGVRNLSREGFGVVSSFGIDYAHQNISLKEVPQRFQTALEEALKTAEYAEFFENIVVELKEAGSSSLDYLLYASFGGGAAASYYSIGRLLQQTCVRVCNEQNWVIPFEQLTIHNADSAAI